MDRLSANWSSEQDKQDWKQAKPLLDELRGAQDKAETIAHSIDEQPAAKMLATEAAPLAKLMLQKATSIIDEEANIASTDQRKSLLIGFADLRGSMATAIGAIRAYLLTADPAFKAEFEELWALNQKKLDALSKRRPEMTSDQQNAFDAIIAARAKFSPLPKKMFDIRGNATIEAARAGEAGRGFAVVAAEVKSLAEHTAKATDQISAQVSSIQTSSSEAVSAIKGITATINEMNEIASAIAGAVEEQGSATQEIARNVSKRLSAPAKSRRTLPLFRRLRAIPEPQRIRFSKHPANYPDSPRRCEARLKPSSQTSRLRDDVPVSLSPSHGSRNLMQVLAFTSGARAGQNQVKRIFAIMAVVTVVVGATTATATARSHYRGHHHHWSIGIRGSNAELRGNNGNSASGSNSLTNPRNAASSP